MRRLDILALGLGLLGGGGLLYWALQSFGVADFDAGLWTQSLLVAGLILWVITYLVRVLTKKMTYAQQLKDYENAVLQKRLDALSPEELAQLQAEVETERHRQQDRESGTEAP
jgi:membrane protein implicated in regulation of membrane protease activity